MKEHRVLGVSRAVRHLVHVEADQQGRGGVVGAPFDLLLELAEAGLTENLAARGVQVLEGLGGGAWWSEKAFFVVIIISSTKRDSLILISKLY